ncbi:MAG: PAS domain-containing sensor histidine kinase [Candidatus Hodarchaeales archaeon]|jgi:signal transduction histidine kinase
MWEEAEVKFKRKDNSTVVLLARSKPIIREGNMYGVQGIAKDITQLRDVEIKKLEFDKSREDFIAIASHELRTPLTIIRGYTDFLERNIQTLEAELIIPFLQTMVKNINRLENLINNVSSIGSIDRAGFKVIFQKFTINPLLIESLKPIEILLGNQLTTSIPKAKIIVKGDPDKIQNVIYNLIENSVKHTLKENREIRVSVITSKDKVRILVRDNGDGVAHENLEKIFGQYGSIPTENCTKGTGIGLYISKKVIEAHNGTLTTESPGIGMSAIFKVELPLFEG